MAIVTLSVTGQILNPDLTPAVGTVTFQIPHDLNDIVDNVTYAPGIFTETLDAFGNFTITGLIATDSPDITETWMYRVHVNTDAYVESFSTSLPAAMAPVADFTDLIPAQVEPCTDDGSPCASVAQLAALQAEVDGIIVGGGVQSVNGDIGPDVVLDAGDVGADPAGSAAAALISANAYTDAEIASIGGVGVDGEVLTLVAGVPSWEPAPAGGGVTSVNGDAGPAVVLDAADVGADLAGSAAAAQAAAIAAANAYTDAEIAALPPDAVTSVNGQVGVVVLDAGDVGADVAGAAAAALTAANAYTDAEIAALPPDAVTSVNGQVGVVVLDAGDVGADPAGSAAAAQAAAVVTANAYTDAEIAAIDFPVDSVNGQTGVVVLDAGDVGADVAGAAAAALVSANAYTDGEIATLDAAVQADLALKLNTPDVAVEQVTTWTAADEWLRIDTPFSAGDTNPDLMRIFNGANIVQRWNGNGEHRTLPSTDSRNGSRHFEFLDGSSDTFWSVSTNPTNPLLRVDLLHVNGTLEGTRPGWTVASEGVEAPEFLQAGLSLLPSAWTVPAFTASWGSSPTVSDGAATGAVDPIGTQFVPALKRVHLRGVILNSTGVSAPAQTVFMTIAAAHRPATWKQFPGRTSTNLAVRITVKETGAVVVDQAIANGASLAFDGISWNMP
jgi:hypothetical protein